MKAWWLIPTVVAVCLGPGDSRADELVSDSIGVLEVATEGVSETAGDMLEESIEETLADVGFRVVRSATVREKLGSADYIAGCTFGPCMAEVKAATGLSRVLVARIQGAGQSYSVVVSLVHTDTGHLIAQVAQSCPVCTVDEAISTAALAVVELVTSPPEGAGEVAGPAPVTPTRDHTARVRKAGWVMLVSGVVAGAAGGYLLTTDEDSTGGVVTGAGAGLGLAGLITVLLAR